MGNDGYTVELQNQRIFSIVPRRLQYIMHAKLCASARQFLRALSLAGPSMRLDANQAHELISGKTKRRRSPTMMRTASTQRSTLMADTSCHSIGRSLKMYSKQCKQQLSILSFFYSSLLPEERQKKDSSRSVPCALSVCLLCVFESPLTPSFPRHAVVVQTELY